MQLFILYFPFSFPIWHILTVSMVSKTEVRTLKDEFSLHELLPFCKAIVMGYQRLFRALLRNDILSQIFLDVL
jgi:hypothetical protein